MSQKTNLVEITDEFMKKNDCDFVLAFGADSIVLVVDDRKLTPDQALFQLEMYIFQRKLAGFGLLPTGGIE